MKLTIIKHPDPTRTKQEKITVLTDKYFDEHTRISFSKLDEFDLFDAAKNDFHIISVAKIGLTNFSAVCQYAYGIDQNEQDRLITPINTNKETGTLFPKHRFTILPYRYRTTPMMTVGEYDYTKGKGFTIEEIEVHIKDALKAETDFIKSNKLLFDFRDFGEDMLRYRNLVHGFLTRDFKDHNWDCYMYSFNNYEFE